MEETLYRIVFNGETIPGLTAQQIVDAFSKRFQVRAEKAREILLNGGRTVLKRNLDQHRAQRYSSALHKVGLLVVMEPQNPARFAPPLSVELNPSIDIAQSEIASAFYDAAPPSQVPVPPPPAPAAPAVAPPPPRSGLHLNDDWPNCPKCGEPTVSPLTGVCQACGVVVERYLARRAEETNGSGGSGNAKASGPAHTDNPYAPPASDLSLPENRGFSGEPLRPPRGVPAGHALNWITGGWQLFKERPWPWIGAFLLYSLITIALGLIPFGVGGLVSSILGPMLTGGLMMGAHQQYRGGGFRVGALFSGMKSRPGPLALVGIAYLGFVVLIAVVTVVGVAGTLVLANPDLLAAIEAGRFNPDQAGPLMLLPVLLAVLIGVPLTMSVYFAPLLVALNEVPVLRAFKLSFQGCWHNILPFLFFGLLALILFIASLFTLGLALLVLIPILIIATYMAYRDIYYR